MARFAVGLVVVAVAFTIFTIVDCAMTAKSRIRGVPKAVWLIVLILLPVIGGIMWLLIGHAPQSAARRAPDDDPTFLRRLGSTPNGGTQRRIEPRRTGGAPSGGRPRKRPESDDEAELRRYEQELANLDTDDDGDGDQGRRRG